MQNKILFHFVAPTTGIQTELNTYMRELGSCLTHLRLVTISNMPDIEVVCYTVQQFLNIQTSLYARKLFRMLCSITIIHIFKYIFK